MSKIVKVFQYGKHRVTLETGQIARQATGAVMVRMEDTVLLVTAVAQKEAESGQGFSALTVDYREKSYAGGKIPGGYFKREGRATEREILISRLIDRALRPLFPKEFTNEVQVIATVLSVDQDVPTDIPAILGASAAICLAGIPFNGPLAAARVGYSQGAYLLNPSLQEIGRSDLELVVAGTEKAVLMVESGARELPESVMLGAVRYGHEQMQVAVCAIREFIDEVGSISWGWQLPQRSAELESGVVNKTQALLEEAYQIPEKVSRQERIQAIRDQLVAELCPSADNAPHESDVAYLFHELERRIVRERILLGYPRSDGRDAQTVRPIEVEVGLLPRAHGSALFTRGETQALVVATLGTERDAQMVDDLEGDRQEEFIFHYNFLPFCVGEVGFMSGPKRREIGHGRLAKRAVESVVPELTEFPYVIRVVSEITESNGSSSMASVCGSSLALMDAGVPISSSVAGIAMGLIKEKEKYTVLTDISGGEDHCGDMDFKVAGTAKGITALQMDIKIEGITQKIMEEALEQARVGRLQILDIMNQVISRPREHISRYAPRIIAFKINPEKIRDVIGKGGTTIRELTETTHSTIDISDDGVIKIAAINSEDGEEARRRIEALVAEVEIGKIYEGPVVKIADFGAFVSVLPGRQGLVHVSQIARERVERVEDYLHVGQIVRVKVVEIDRQGRIRLSMKEVAEQYHSVEEQKS